MRYARLVIQADQATVSLAFHPRLTVVAGVDERVRAGLTEELLGGLTSIRAGVLIELDGDDGRRRILRRTQDGDEVLIDAASGRDESDRYRGPDGCINLLGAHGLDQQAARRELRISPGDLRVAKTDPRVTRLGELDQAALWSAAATVRVTEDALTALQRRLAADGEDPEVIARVEREHQAVESTLAQHRWLARVPMLIAGLVGGAAGVAVGLRPSLATPLLVIAAAAAIVSLALRLRVAWAQRAEKAALAAAGAGSYLGFVVKRVEGMFSDSDQRRRLLAVADDHRAASVRWTRLAGDVSVGWAMEHHDEIEASARLRRQVRALAAVSSSAPMLDESTAEMAQALLAHLARLARRGAGGESLPLILDDPFGHEAPANRMVLLELLARAAGTPQVILLTDTEDAATWARLESLTGEVALVEPQTEVRPVSELAV